MGVIAREDVTTDQFLRRKALDRLAVVLREKYGAELVGRNDSVPHDRALLFTVPTDMCIALLQGFDNTDNICDNINEWYERMTLPDPESMRTRLYYQMYWYPVRRKLVQFLVCCLPPRAVEGRLFAKPPFAFMSATLIKTFPAMNIFDERRTIERLILLNK